MKKKKIGKRWALPKKIRNFGNLIRHYRCKDQITQQRMSKLSGISQGWYSKIEAENKTPNLDEGIRICKALDIPFHKVQRLYGLRERD